jgi:predicted nicotinamide N-methyase
VLPQNERNLNVLVDICLSGNRTDASYAAPSEGLALAGVGYNMVDMVPLATESKKSIKKKLQLESKKRKLDGATPSGPDPKLPVSATNKGYTNDSEAEVDAFWQQFGGELVSVDNASTFYPERNFSFVHAGELLLEQNAGDVGTIVWDSEVLLAHFMDSRPVSNLRVVELGAGAALAAAVCYRNGASIAFQELSHIVPYSMSTLSKCGVPAEDVVSFSGKWGELDPVTIMYDFVIMADVLYHAEDYSQLINTIQSFCKPSSTVIIAVEQRRKCLDEFIIGMKAAGFYRKKQLKYSIPSKESEQVTDFHLWEFTCLGLTTTRT